MLDTAGYSVFGLLRFLETGQDPSLALRATYDPVLVCLSITISVLASYAGFGMAEQAREDISRNERMAWLTASALAIGGGTWTMHFMGMLAWKLEIPVNYDFPLTLLSAVPAVVAGAAFAMVIGLGPTVKYPNIVTGGIVMGLGIGVMHYTGMAAMRMEAAIYYDPFMFGLSVLIAVTFSCCALWVKIFVLKNRQLQGTQIGLIGSALLIGTAISIMHYTGMMGSFCFARPGAAINNADTRYLAIIVGLLTVTLLTLAVVASQIVNRLRVIPILKREISRRKEIERELKINREALRKSYEELESRVIQRTHELSVEIAERKRIESELVMSIRESENSNRMKSAFLSHMSHEFRTPLNGIIGYLEFLSMDISKSYSHDKIQSVVSEILTASRHLLSLTNSVLDLSRIEAGMEEVNPGPVELPDSILYCMDLVHAVADKKKITIELAEMTTPQVVLCDVKHFNQILINILSNAINYTNFGGKIDISLRDEQDGYVHILVRDNGIGIPANDIPRVFKEFERSYNAMISSSSGTGLGLPLTRRLVELNGGSISLSSDVGIGTVVTLRFRADGNAMPAQQNADANLSS